MTAIAASCDTNTNGTTNMVPLYRHVKRPSWGLGVLAWERGDRRAYQFEDGGVRVIKKGYYGMLVGTSAPNLSVRQKLAVLCARSGVTPVASGSRGATFGDQMTLFRSLYPAGFEDLAWQKKIRGAQAKRRIKRHREAAIAHASDLLSQDKLDAMLAGGDCQDIVNVLVEVMTATDLINDSQMKPLFGIASHDYHRLTQTLRDFLYGSGEVSERFDALRRVLRTRNHQPSWQLCTAVGALVRPDEHVYVRPKALEVQAKILGSSVTVERRPRGGVYERLQAMARRVHDNLTLLGMSPRDLLDVYDFMWTTLRPSAQKQLGTLPMILPLQSKAKPAPASEPAVDEPAMDESAMDERAAA